MELVVSLEITKFLLMLMLFLIKRIKINKNQFIKDGMKFKYLSK